MLYHCPQQQQPGINSSQDSNSRQVATAAWKQNQPGRKSSVVITVARQQQPPGITSQPQQPGSNSIQTAKTARQQRQPGTSSNQVATATNLKAQLSINSSLVAIAASNCNKDIRQHQERGSTTSQVITASREASGNTISGNKDLSSRLQQLPGNMRQVAEYYHNSQILQHRQQQAPNREESGRGSRQQRRFVTIYSNSIQTETLFRSLEELGQYRKGVKAKNLQVRVSLQKRHVSKYPGSQSCQVGQLTRRQTAQISSSSNPKISKKFIFCESKKNPIYV